MQESADMNKESTSSIWLGSKYSLIKPFYIQQLSSCSSKWLSNLKNLVQCLYFLFNNYLLLDSNIIRDIDKQSKLDIWGFVH